MLTICMRRSPRSAAGSGYVNSPLLRPYSPSSSNGAGATSKAAASQAARKAGVHGASTGALHGDYAALNQQHRVAPSYSPGSGGMPMGVPMGMGGIQGMQGMQGMQMGHPSQGVPPYGAAAMPGGFPPGGFAPGGFAPGGFVGGPVPVQYGVPSGYPGYTHMS